MGLYKFEDKKPSIGHGTFIFDTACVVGDVVIGEQCIIMPGASIKGDYGKIRIGHKCNIQDNCILHARPGEELVIGNNVTIGHGSTLHNCTIEDFATIGMRAVVSDYAIVGESAVIAEGAVVRQNQEIPKKMVAVGVPAKILGEVKPETGAELVLFKEKYVEMANRYLQPGALQRLD